MRPVGLRGLSPDRLYQTTNAQNAHYPFDVVGEDVNAISVPTCLSVFIWKCVDPIQDFNRTEGMLDRLATQTHLVRVAIKPRLHRLKDGFVLPA